MNFDYGEVMTGWWIRACWDDSVSAGKNLRRFRAWWEDNCEQDG